MRRERIPLVAVAWLAALLPALAANLAYVISASAELVPWCVPYFEGCTSVSRAARTGAAAPVFKALMLPYCVVFAAFWWLTARWLGALRPQWHRTRRALPMLGLVAAVATATYALALGVEGELYQWLRRYGINLSFALTVLAELLVAAALANEPRVPKPLRRAMVGLCLTMLLLGIASLPLQYLVADRGAALNAIEWSYSLLMLAFFPLVGEASRRAAHPAPVSVRAVGSSP